ncbi:MAG: 2-dehydropantoate 2-reductase [Kiloniellales bacterium]|nr:2-dehydropantoate 2-reductase [Kiloniellales bacterium]
MRFVIVGAGGVGGYFGARLAAAGHQVTFIARGAHGAAMASGGLTVRSELGDLHIDEPAVFTDPAAAGACDFLLLCVKMQDLVPLADTLRPLISPGTAVVPLQNGVEAEEMLRKALGPDCVMGGVAYIFAHIAEPGKIQHVGQVARLAFGELDGQETERQKALLAACAAAGIGAEATGSIDDRIWRKFALLAPLAGATCLGRCPVGGVRADPRLWAKLVAMVGEAVALGRVRGVSLPEDLEARTLKAVNQLDAGMKTSMLTDLEAGKPLELEWLNGAVVRLGREAGLATPANAEVVAALRPLAGGASGTPKRTPRR